MENDRAKAFAKPDKKTDAQYTHVTAVPERQCDHGRNAALRPSFRLGLWQPTEAKVLPWSS